MCVIIASSKRNGKAVSTSNELEVTPMVTYSDLFQFCLVIIGIAGIVIQACNRK